jgi:hypothetical protein
MGLLSIAAIFVAALCLTMGAARAGKPQSAVPVTIAFWNDTNVYKITGDGAGTQTDYEHGKGGVSADILPTTGDLRLNLNQTRKPPRFLDCDLSAQVAGSPSLPATEATFMNVGIGSGDLLAMGEGTSQPMNAFFFSADVGALRFQPDLIVGTAQVLVVRSGASTWETSTQPVSATQPDDDVAGLDQEPSAWYFHLPFRCTVRATGPLP